MRNISSNLFKLVLNFFGNMYVAFCGKQLIMFPQKCFLVCPKLKAIAIFQV